MKLPRMKRFGALLFCGLVFFATLARAEDDLHPKIDAILRNSRLEGTRFGIRVIHLPAHTGGLYRPEGEVLYSYRADELYAAASNTKLFATSAALVRLGPDYEFKTRIYARGKIEKGVLQGDLIILGAGDPNISGRFHQGNTLAIPRRWAKATRARGIKKITGSIIADDRFFDRIATHPKWPSEELSYWYAAPISALSFNDNCLKLIVTPAKSRHVRATVLKSPPTSYVKIKERPRVVAEGSSSLVIYRLPRTNTVGVGGEIPIGSSPVSLWVTVHNPPLYLATVFREELERSGVEVAGQVRLVEQNEQIDYKRLALISEHKSTLAQSIEIANKRSQNFYSEQILKTLGKEIKGKGSWLAGIRAVADFLEELGIEPGSYQMVDGSGLARENEFSPLQITTLLKFMAAEEFGQTWKESLSSAGVDGTLRNRLRRRPYKGRILGKTGTADEISTLSGYVNTLSGETLAFSFLFNDFEGSSQPIKAIEDQILQVLVQWRP